MFIVLCFIVGPVVHFELLFGRVEDLSTSSFISYFLHRCPGVPTSFVGKTFLHCIAFVSLSKSADCVCVGLFVGSTFYFIDLSVYYSAGPTTLT